MNPDPRHDNADMLIKQSHNLTHPMICRVCRSLSRQAAAVHINAMKQRMGAVPVGLTEMIRLSRFHQVHDLTRVARAALRQLL